MDMLDSALAKMPKYKGYLGRSVSFADEQGVRDYIKKYAVHAEQINFDQYISATTSKNHHNPDAQIEVTILSKSGRDIRFLNIKEQEVLFGRDARFLFKGRFDTDKINLYFEEV